MNSIARMFARYLFLCFLGVVLSACGGWDAREEWGSSGIWSDDGQSILLSKSFYERKREFGATVYSTRNHETQLFVVPANNLQSITPLTSKLSGRFIEAEYKRSAGYLVVKRQAETSVEESGNTQITRTQTSLDKITVDGSISSIASVNGITMLGCNNDGSSYAYPGPVEALSSPGADQIAVFEFNASCSETTGTVKFLNAEDLSLIASPISLELAEFNAATAFFTFEEVWLQSGEVFAGFLGGMGQAGFTGWKYAPDQQPIRVQNLSSQCIFSNDYVNSQGQRVDVRGSTNETPEVVVVDELDFEAPDDCP